LRVVFDATLSTRFVENGLAADNLNIYQEKMEFYDLDLTMFNITTNSYPIKDCTHEFNSGAAIVMNVLGLVFMLIRVCGWCRDPLAEDLQKKIRELEEQNDELTVENEDLSDEIKELKTYNNDISERLRRANESLDNLRSVLDIVRPVDNVTADTQG
jgi:signal transduction histidine kinase